MTTQPLSPQDAQQRLMNYCSRFETCTSKAMAKLSQWQVEPRQRHAIVQYLIEHKFIDDMRYAEMFARSKHSQKWGIVKIRNHLQMHGISSEIIEQALENIDTSQEIAILEEILRKKLPYLKAKTPLELKQKLLRYAIGKGYNYSTAAQAIKNIRQNLTAD